MLLYSIIYLRFESTKSLRNDESIGLEGNEMTAGSSNAEEG